MSLSKASDIFKKGNELNDQSHVYSSEDIADRFNNTLESLNNILSVSNGKNGTPIYSVWIKFQLGEDNPILFDSQSDIYERNLIANLNMSKGQNGYANTFTLDIYYDAFKNGQETNQSTAEVLDEWVATAMSYDYNSDTSDFLKGYLQYGYNQLDDTDRQLYTPVYEFYLTDASSETNYISGITHYTFQGTSMISSDINFLANIEKQENKRPLNVVKDVLTEYYSPLDYEIDISEELLNEQQTDNIEPIDAVTINPLNYCKDILDKYNLNQAEIDSGEYTPEKLQNMRYGQIPQYSLFITENNGQKVIHINHTSKSTLGTIISVNYVFDWSNTNNNIVISWKPEADLKFYLIQMGNHKRGNRDLNYWTQIEASNTKNIQDTNFIGPVMSPMFVNEQIELAKQKSADAKDNLIKEYYDATLECVGIPTDAPIGGIIRIKPVLFQSVSRTAGIYFIKGAEDTINTNGIFKTTLTLFRINDLTYWNQYLAQNETHNGIYGPVQDPNRNLYSESDNQRSDTTNKKHDYSYRDQLSPEGGPVSVLNNLGNGPYTGPLN